MEAFALGSNLKERPVIHVTAALLIHNGKVFAAKRSSGRHLAGYWEFPGGKIEANETASECLKRELAEELNLSTEIGSFFMKTTHDYGDKKVVLHVYQIASFMGELQLVDHDEYRWLSLTDCTPLKWAPADIPIVNRLATIL